MDNTNYMNCTMDIEKEDDRTIENLQDDYYRQVTNLIKGMEEVAENNPFLELKLEKELLDVEAFEDKNCKPEDCRFIYFNRFHEKLAMREIDNSHSEDLEKIIQKIIIKGKFRNREQLLSYWCGIPYKVRTSDEHIEVMSWDAYGELTRIQPIRLSEKIESCAKNLKRNHIRVACFGKLYGDITALTDYLVKQQIEISIDEFIPQEKEQTFSCNGHICNFDIYSDMQNVVEHYDLIIMTDNTHFYRRFQSIKSEEENHSAEYVNLYWDMAQKTEDVWDKNMYYYLLFKSAVDYVAGRNNKMSARFEFDEQILNRWKFVLESVEKKAEVYCYISENNVIANEDISNNNVCKDEYYDGKNLIVYKINEPREEIHENYEHIVNEKMDNYVFIDMWKFIKSIGNDFYEEFSQMQSQWSIDEWRSCKLIINLNYLKRNENEVIISYDFACTNNEMMICARNLFECILRLMYESSFSCVRSYLKNLVSDAIMTRSNSVKGIVFAYLLKNRLNVKFVYQLSEKQPKFTGSHMDYKTKKNIYIILEKLNQTIIRNMDFKDMILFTEFRLKYVSDISEQLLYQYLRLIHEACEEFGDTFSRIYNYSDVD